MTLLDDIISASSNDGVSTSNLLRMVLVAASRVGADAVASWARGELRGFNDEASAPDFRVGIAVPATGLFVGYANSQIRTGLSSVGVPDDFDASWFHVAFLQPVSELDALAHTAGENNPVRQWPPVAVAQYQSFGVFAVEGYDLFSASNSISRQLILGIVDTIRTRALEFALELQRDFPTAGEVDGPTVTTEPQLAQAVYNITNNITGHGANIAAGEHIRQTSIAVGDADGLKQAAIRLGLSELDAQEFVASVVAEQATSGSRLRDFLSRVRSGAIGLAGKVAVNVATAELLAAANQFLGHSR